MKKLGIALALSLASSVLLAAASLAQPIEYGHGLAPSLQEFNDSAHRG